MRQLDWVRELQCERNSIASSKAIDLLHLADLATSRHCGVTLDDVADAFRVSHRTAQRIVQAPATEFSHAVEVTEDPDRRRRWTMRETPLARLRPGGVEELQALEMAARLRDDGDGLQSGECGKPARPAAGGAAPRQMCRAEADAEAMLGAHGAAARPGRWWWSAARPGYRSRILHQLHREAIAARISLHQ